MNNFIKSKMNSSKTQPNIQKIIKKIDKYKYVSFDIFDTLLKRNVYEAEQVFEIIEKTTNIKDFKQKRILAEQLAREKNIKEIDLNDIYDCYPEKIDKEKIINLEQDIEKKVLVKNPYIYPIYKHCIESKKKIIIASDMYLDETFLKKVLSQNNITKYDFLFVSNKINATKSSGTMYKYILNKLKIHPSNIIHIGDNFKSDYIQCQKHKIKSIHIKRNIKDESEIKYNNIHENYLNNFIKNNKYEDFFYDFGFKNYGVFLLGYNNWIIQQLHEQKINKVYFFSRDGYIMKQVFDKINKDKNIKSYYLEVSRRSLRVPTLWMNSDLKSVLDIISPSSNMKVSTFFDDIGLDIENYSEVLKKLEIDKEHIFETKKLSNNKKFINLFNQIQKDFIQNSKIEYENLKKYISQNDLNGKFAIVDIGWSGSMQRFLHQTLEQLKIEHEICGYYTGVAKYYERNKKYYPEINMNGYIFDFAHNKKDYDKRNSFVGLFESLFLENKGSVKKYLESNNKIIVERYPYEYQIDGNYTFSYQLIKEIQNGALDFINEYIKRELFCNNVISSEYAFERLYKVGIQPNKKQLSYLSELEFFDEGIINKLAVPDKIYKYILNPKKFKNDFLSSRWKIGFLKKIIKINISYEKIYNFLLKFK